jgi:hypothetical protein
MPATWDNHKTDFIINLAVELVPRLIATDSFELIFGEELLPHQGERRVC